MSISFRGTRKAAPNQVCQRHINNMKMQFVNVRKSILSMLILLSESCQTKDADYVENYAAFKALALTLSTRNDKKEESDHIENKATFLEDLVSCSGLQKDMEEILIRSINDGSLNLAIRPDGGLEISWKVDSVVFASDQSALIRVTDR